MLGLTAWGSIGLAVALVAVDVRPAGACSRLAGESHAAVSNVIPSNGVLVVNAQCYDCVDYAAPATFVIKDDADADVGVELVDSGLVPWGSWLAFKPLQPWTPDAGYVLLGKSALLSGSSQDARLAFKATAAVALDATAIAFEATVRVVKLPSGTQRCCEQGAGNSCSNSPPCWFDEATLSPYLELTATLPPNSDGQYAFGLQWLADGEAQGVTEWTLEPKFGFTYDAQATEYCAQVSAKTLNDGQVAELGTVCAQYTGIEVLGTHPISPFDLQQALLQCQAPPESHFAEWCDTHAACYMDECTLAREQCDARMDDEAQAACSVLATRPPRSVLATRPSSSGWGAGYLALLLALGLRRARS